MPGKLQAAIVDPCFNRCREIWVVLGVNRDAWPSLAEFFEHGDDVYAGGTVPFHDGDEAVLELWSAGIRLGGRHIDDFRCL